MSRTFNHTLREFFDLDSEPTNNALHQLLPPPHDFTGREQELKQLLAATERGSVISGLQGLGGVGKTALALKLAERLKDRCPDAQFYLDLRGVSQRPVTPAEAMAHVIRAYHPTARLPESEAELQPLFGRRFSIRSGATFGSGRRGLKPGLRKITTRRSSALITRMPVIKYFLCANTRANKSTGWKFSLPPPGS